MATGKDIEQIGARLGQISGRGAALQQTTADLKEAAVLKKRAADFSLVEQKRILAIAADAQLLAMGGLGLLSNNPETP